MANDFLPFATGGTPNVLSQAAWSALAARSTGFQAGVADSAQLNKAWRQSAAMAAAIGTLVDQNGGDALDNGDIAALAVAIRQAFGGRLLRVLAFTSSATYTPHAQMGRVRVTAIGGGGGGGGALNPGAGQVSLGAPGGAGTVAQGLYAAATVGASLTVTVGAGGAANSGGNGGNGGSTSFGSLLTCPGGVGGGMFNFATPPQANGNGTLSSAASGANLWSARGGAEGLTLGLGASAGFGGPGGRSWFGAGTGPVNFGAAGVAGASPGSGGAGIAIGAGGGTVAGGAGAAGIVIVEEYSA